MPTFLVNPSEEDIGGRYGLELDYWKCAAASTVAVARSATTAAAACCNSLHVAAMRAVARAFLNNRTCSVLSCKELESCIR